MNAQYTLAQGVRLSGTSGFTIKHKHSTMAFDGILGVFPKRFKYNRTGLLERQLSPNVEGLYLYYDGGLHLAFYNGSHYNRFGRDVTDTNTDGFDLAYIQLQNRIQITRDHSIRFYL